VKKIVVTGDDLKNELSREIEGMIASAMRRDQFPLRKKLAYLTQQPPGNDTDCDSPWHSLRADVQRSVQQKKLRAELVPTVHLDKELPIFARADEISDAIRNHQLAVISGETGSGKSTQLPLIALQAGFGLGGLIGHTQPRRIAARSVANRIAHQLRTILGQAVGFKIRFDDKTSDATYIKMMTDGILLAETERDRFLDHYEILIIDEAHERSLNIDFLLGYVRRILPRRPDLRVIITSATIDAERFAQHFEPVLGCPVPVIEIAGRNFPVEIRYRPPVGEDDDLEIDVLDAVVEAVKEFAAEDDGDILVFLPTESDIRTASRKLRGTKWAGRATDILPLYARLNTEQQNLIFAPSANRRIVLATNVAESSITVPGIRAVIDSGTARISRYSPRSKVQRLPIEAVSQASADQRAGRCGRVGPGVCIRLYSQEDYESRMKYTTPEIRRTHLAAVVLRTLALNLGEIGKFPFLDPPHRDAVRDGYKTLFEIGAIDSHRRLTRLGRWLA
jgi:ATP-dependent helicase HrpA